LSLGKFSRLTGWVDAVGESPFDAKDDRVLGGNVMDKEDRVARQTGGFDDPHDTIDPFAWGLLFAVIEGSRLWHERRHATKKANDPRIAVGTRSTSPRPPLRNSMRRSKV
jgi:hypothetical protein